MAFSRHVEETYFRKGESVHFELFPSTTKSIEAFCALLAHEASLRERPIKILLPKDAHFCWTNVLASYSTHPLLKVLHLDPDVGDDASLRAARFRPGDLVVGVFTFAGRVGAHDAGGVVPPVLLRSEARPAWLWMLRSRFGVARLPGPPRGRGRGGRARDLDGAMGMCRAASRTLG